MFDDRAMSRQQKLQELARLKNEALLALERRGYEVRGKTAAQIREILRRRPTKRGAAARQDGASP